MRSRHLAIGLIGILVLTLIVGGALAYLHPAAAKPASIATPFVRHPIHQDVSAPLSSYVTGANPVKPGETEGRTRTKFIPIHGAATPRADGATQSATPHPNVSTTSGLSFAGVGQGDYGYSDSVAPPDTEGAVGATQYVQWVNSSYAVFNKSTGALVLGPVAGNSLFSGFGGGCQTNNDGDPIVKYDQLAGRWVFTQFSVSTTPYLQCVAVSTTSDATGSYNRYSFQYSNFNDYPKMGIWPDGYYITYNLFNGNTFLGSEDCAFDRSKMLTGAAATQVCFTTDNTQGGVLPTDLDGSIQPSSGEPNFFMNFGTNALNLWKFHVDFTTPANSTFTGPTSIAVAAFSAACSGGGTCIPQQSTTNQLDSLADRLMYRLAYRHFADGHESLVVNHSVTAGSSVGVRWYEIRSPNGTPSVYQQSTYAPDATYRWMGSVAMDQQGNMLMGYSASSSALYPSIRYTGRLATDTLSTMQAENTLKTGAGAETTGLTRWGDYSAMTVDPSDDCTFWYTNEYEKASGTFNWSTWIGSFKFSGCGSTGTNDFSISSSPTSLSIQQGNSGTATISTAVTSGSAGTVSLAASVSPSGPTASLSPTSVTAGGSSTLTVSVGSTVATGTYTVTVTGTEGSATHTTTVTVTVTAPATNDFSISASPTSLSIQQGANGTATISTAVTSGSAGTVSLTASVSPSGPTASLSPTSVTAGNSSTLTITVGSAVATGSYTVTVTGIEGSATHTTTVAVTVTSASSGGLTNGGFETGNFTGWTTAGTTSISTSAHSGTYAGQAGATSATNGDSSIAQTFTVPSGSAKLSFWYKVVCPDTVTYDWATATLKDNTANTTTTILAKTCTNTGSWVQVSAGVTAGHSVTLTLISHDDNYAGDPTYTLFDDVALSAGVTNPVVNPGFETGNFTGWTTAGTTSISTSAHSGTYAGQAGGTTATNGDSSIAQTFTIPSGASTVSFWYKVVCPDTVTYDWATATLKDNTANTTTTILAKTCTNTGSWVQVSAGVTAGHSVTLTLISHDDNYAGDPTYTLFDDVSVN